MRKCEKEKSRISERKQRDWYTAENVLLSDTSKRLCWHDAAIVDEAAIISCEQTPVKDHSD